MSKEKIVTIFVEEGVILRITNDMQKADYVISSENTNIVTNRNIEVSIKEYLLGNKISLNAGGFNYLVSAIIIVNEKLENNKRYSLTKDVYPVVARIYSVTPSSVERAIWNAIKRSDAKGSGAKRFIEKYKLGM